MWPNVSHIAALYYIIIAFYPSLPPTLNTVLSYYNMLNSPFGVHLIVLQAIPPQKHNLEYIYNKIEKSFSILLVEINYNLL